MPQIRHIAVISGSRRAYKDLVQSLPSIGESHDYNNYHFVYCSQNIAGKHFHEVIKTHDWQLASDAIKLHDECILRIKPN